MSIRFLVGTGPNADRKFATDKQYLFWAYHRTMTNVQWIFAPNREAAINEYNRTHTAIKEPSDQ